MRRSITRREEAWDERRPSRTARFPAEKSRFFRGISAAFTPGAAKNGIQGLRFSSVHFPFQKPPCINSRDSSAAKKPRNAGRFLFPEDHSKGASSVQSSDRDAPCFYRLIQPFFGRPFRTRDGIDHAALVFVVGVFLNQLHTVRPRHADRGRVVGLHARTPSPGRRAPPPAHSRASASRGGDDSRFPA